MIYQSTIAVNKGGSAAAKSETTLAVTRGLIWLVEIEFPPGCCGLAHLQIFDGSYQVAPSTPGESFHGDAVTLSLDDLYMKDAAPWQLIVKTWNTDDTYDHQLTVRVGQAQSEAEMSRYMPAVSFENFEALLADLLAKQENVRQLQLEAALKDLIPESDEQRET